MRLTKTQTKLMELLADGLPHPRKELLTCFRRERNDNNLNVHLWNLRQQLRSRGIGIINHGRGGYQVCRFVVGRPRAGAGESTS